MKIRFLRKNCMKDKSSSFSVCHYRVLDTGEEIVCTGNNLPDYKKVVIDAELEGFVHKIYGQEYKILSYSIVVDSDDRESIISFLSSKYIAGISRPLAERIYEKFGALTMDVLDNNIERLLEVKGIKDKKFEKIRNSYHERKAEIELGKYILPFGLPIEACSKIYKKYGTDSLSVIKKEPYRLCEEIRGITFKNSDLIAKSNGISEDNKDRIIAAAHCVLREGLQTGSVCMSPEEFGLALINLLNTKLVDKSNVSGYTTFMIKNRDIRLISRGLTKNIYLPAAFDAEANIAKKLREQLLHKKRKVQDLDKLIDQFSDGILLDKSQRDAIKMGVTEPVFIITGGPGTGKTTILRIIARINQCVNKGKNNNVLLAPTGRAARRMTESTGFDASTIHSALGIGIKDEDENEGTVAVSDTIENSAVLIDEASMLDLWIMDALVSSTINCTLGFIGDADQLPSVQCGAVLRDMIASRIIPCIHLEYIHRQSEEAINICENAYNIRNGRKSLKTGDDFIIKESSGLKDAEEKLIESALYDIDRFSLDNTKVLCPVKKKTCGVYEINNVLQSVINLNDGSLTVPLSDNMVLRRNDPVMQLKNTECVSNGDIGYVISITEDEVIVFFSVQNDIVISSYSYKEAKEQLLPAYATTVHKSQGSEYDAVTFCLVDEHYFMKKRNLFYTAVTRSSKKLTLIGTLSAFYNAIDNDMTDERVTSLAYKLNPKADTEDPSGNAAAPVIADDRKYEQLTLPFC